MADGISERDDAIRAWAEQCRALEAERDVLRRERDEAQAELAGIDAVMARRPALDRPTRRENIEKAITTAGQYERAELALTRVVAERDVLRARCQELEAAMLWPPSPAHDETPEGA